MAAAATPPGIAAISVPTPFAMGSVNVYLLEGEPLTLVDAGPNQGESLAALERGLAERGRRVEDLELILLTHQHHDHVGLARRLQERSGAQVAAIAPLATFLADFEASMDADDAYAVAMMHRHGVEDDVARHLNEVSLSWRGMGGGVPVDRLLGDGETIVAGGRTLTAHVRPGHSPTDTVFHDAAARVLVAGDHLLERISSNPIAHAPIGVANPAAAAASAERPRPLLDYVASFARTRALEVSTVLPGHGPPFTGHREVIDGRMEMHRRRAERVLRLVDGRPTAADIASGLWRHLAVNQAYLALSEVIGHLDLLAAEGRVREEPDGDLVRLAPI